MERIKTIRIAEDLHLELRKELLEKRNIYKTLQELIDSKLREKK